MSFIALFTRVGWGSGLYVRVMLCHSAFGAGVCALVSVLGVFCEIIFIRSHVLVLVFTSCVGGGGGGICFVEELWLWM